jgi:hypothetical protein
MDSEGPQRRSEQIIRGFGDTTTKGIQNPTQLESITSAQEASPMDSEGPLRRSEQIIRGVGDITTKGIQLGTLLWRWADDNGQTHTFRIPNSCNVPNGGVKLLKSSTPGTIATGC